MLNGGILGVVIGLILVFLLLSALVSGINEVIEAMLNNGRRARYLEAGLMDLLGPKLKDRLYNQGLIQALTSPRGGPRRVEKRESTDPPKKLIGEGDRTLKQKKPSYIPNRTFADAMLSIVLDGSAELKAALPAAGAAGPLSVTMDSPIGFPPAPFHVQIDEETFAVTAVAGDTWTVERDGGTAADHAAGSAVRRVRTEPVKAEEATKGLLSTINSLPDSEFKVAASGLVRSASTTIDELRSSVERLFQEKMDRVSGWYKRRTKIALFVIGLVTVLLLNVDTGLIGRTLWTNDVLRNSVVDIATSTAQSGQPSCKTASAPEQCVADRIGDLKALGIPIGWPTFGSFKDLNILDWRNWGKQAYADDPRVPHRLADLWLKLSGLLITALALTLGAPFWFDLLNKFINLRSTGRPPSTTNGDDTSIKVTPSTGASVTVSPSP